MGGSAAFISQVSDPRPGAPAGFTGLRLGKVLAFPPKRSLDGAPLFWENPHRAGLGRATPRSQFWNLAPSTGDDLIVARPRPPAK
jgi:hypothetical protein